ncbi:thyrotropin-releasing hormone receptor-like [Haliotis rubra]|uniref:thyrotropin-releasing hormone receptor-like n=1 Tax=Haliotis rubra TaxID=36100 RepID=UPI001EE52B69|nr:thyrotropin-releasing hormone receptor-like [Haliotis rubra]
MSLGAILEYHGDANFTQEFQFPLYGNNGTDHLVEIAHAISLYLIPTICFLGIVGNVCSFFVFTLSTFRFLPCSLYLAALAVSDTGFLAALFMAWLTSVMPWVAMAPGLCLTMVYITYVCSFLSAWYVVLMMVERFVVVCHPLKAPRYVTKKRSRMAVGLVTAFALILYLHSFLSTYVNVTVYGPSCSAREQYMKFNAIFTYIDSLVTFVVPFTAIVVLNIRIILTVRNFRLKHHPLHMYCMHQSEPGVLTQAQVRSTKMLVLVSSIFVVLYLPSHAIRMYLLVRVLVRNDHWMYDHTTVLAQQICQFPYFINFAVDFLVYSITSKNFRKNGVKLFRRMCDDD